MKKIKVGIIGATGAVGQQMLECLVERNIPIEELRCFASERSAGKVIQFNGQDIVLQTVTKEGLQGLDFVLGAAENEQAIEYAPMIKEANAIFIDNSSAFRMDPTVPLIIPEINGADAFKHQGIIANPNCSTIITFMVMGAINAVNKVEKMVVSTYQAVSGAGVGGMRELNQQINAIHEQKEVEVSVFKKQIAYNAIPQIGGFDAFGYTSEEMKMQNEGRKILHNSDMVVNCTCVRIPVMRSHSISVYAQLEKTMTPTEVKEVLKQAKGVVLYDELNGSEVATPLDSGMQDDIFVSRIRQDLSCDKAISLWCCGDQIRKGAASNCVQILQLFCQ